MNSDQIKGKIKEVAGEAQEHLGRMVGSKEQEAKGHAKEFAGKAQQKLGDAKEIAEDLKEDLDDKAKQSAKYREERDEDYTGRVI